VIGWEECTAEEALNEISREVGLRERCFPGWVKDGKVTQTDAGDRLKRLTKAGEIIHWAMQQPGCPGAETY